MLLPRSSSPSRSRYHLPHLRPLPLVAPPSSLRCQTPDQRARRSRSLAPGPDDEVKTAGLEGAAEVCDGFYKEGGVVGAGAVEAGDKPTKVVGVEAKEGEEGKGVGLDYGGAVEAEGVGWRWQE
ncbi:hypothetical protein MRB53_030324 [Persea americana]|uniref:Uncharacterized protein n=1 Tax=Persea americana TaxID=3435 RepID=A0ACC2KKZ6_PERAE|nr:hypothetical protein MRB53_030324 [Persea americana]